MQTNIEQILETTETNYLYFYVINSFYWIHSLVLIKYITPKAKKKKTIFLMTD